MNKTRFTLRLDESEFQELARIKELAALSTNTSAIRYVIRNFIALNERYIDEIKKSASLKEKYKEQDKCVEDLLCSLEKLRCMKGLNVITSRNKKK